VYAIGISFTAGCRPYTFVTSMSVFLFSILAMAKIENETLEIKIKIKLLTPLLTAILATEPCR